MDEVKGVERGHLPPPPSPRPCPKFSFFMCVVVKCGDLIETVINSA